MSNSKQFNTFTDNGSEWIFNNQRYIVNVAISNGESTLPINAANIISISVTESIYSVFPEIKLILNNDGNPIENNVSDISGELKQRVFSEAFNFDAFGREGFVINIMPVNSDNSEFNELYRISGFFLTYDEDEYVYGKSSTKQKIYFLRDYREQLLHENNVEWSTADVVKSDLQFNINLKHLSNSAREAKTGECIKHLISNAITESTFVSDFDKGATNVFYSSPAQYKAYDDLEFLLDNHVSADNFDPGILRCERTGSFSLRSLSKYFDLGYIKNDISPLLNDIFAINAGTFNRSDDPDSFGTVIPGHNIDSDMYSKLEGIDGFSLLHVANQDSSNLLVTNIVHSYDNTSKQFNVECNKTNIVDVKDKFTKLYASKMPGRQENSKASAVLPINEFKYENKLHNHSFGPSGEPEKRFPIGINKTIKSALFLSPSLNFNVLGSTHRTPGRFILISLRHADKDAPLTKLLVGEWFISKVNHAFVFSTNSYGNNVTCIKPHSNEPLTTVTINKENLEQTREQWEVAPSGATDIPQEFNNIA